MTDQKNMSLARSMEVSRERGIRAAHVKAAAQREQQAEEETETPRKYGGGRALRRPGRLDEVPPHCYREPGMSDDEATVAAAQAMNITDPLDVLLLFFALRAGSSNPTASAAHPLETTG